MFSSYLGVYGTFVHDVSFMFFRRHFKLASGLVYGTALGAYENLSNSYISGVDSSSNYFVPFNCFRYLAREWF